MLNEHFFERDIVLLVNILIRNIKIISFFSTLLPLLSFTCKILRFNQVLQLI